MKTSFLENDSPQIQQNRDEKKKQQTNQSYQSELFVSFWLDKLFATMKNDHIVVELIPNLTRENKNETFINCILLNLCPMILLGF